MNSEFQALFERAKSYDAVQSFYRKLNYVFFDRGSFNVNIFGIRNLTSGNREDVYDDAIGIAYRDKRGRPTVFVDWGTTMPGVAFLRRPIYFEGTAAVVEGQYRGLWALGVHLRKRALIQVGNVLLFRDNNKDSKYDFDYSNTRWFGPEAGIFLHESYSGVERPEWIGRSSAGCIVPQSSTFVSFVCDRVKDQENAGLGKRVTFTLFTSKQLLS